MTEQTRVLIGDDSKNNGHTLARALIERNMYAVTRPKNGFVVLETAISDRFDVLVIEAKMPELDAVSVIKEINAVSDYSPIIVVISNYNSFHAEKEVMEAGAAYYMLKPFMPMVLADRIEMLMNTPNISSRKNASYDEYDYVPGNIEYIVTDIINKIGIPAHIKGYNFLRNAIMLSVENPEMVDRITKLLYPTVASKYGTTSSRVERAIRHAVEIACGKGNTGELSGFIGYAVRPEKGKLTNSEFIASIADKLRLKLKAV